MTRIKVALLTDDYYSRYALHSLLIRDRRTMVIDEAGDLEELEWVLGTARGQPSPDVVLVDVDRFNRAMSPVQMVESLSLLLKGTARGCRIVCLAKTPSLAFIRRAVSLGVDAILEKDEVGSRIADAVVKVEEGRFVHTRSVSECAFGRLKGISHEACHLLRSPQPLPLNQRLGRAASLYCVDGLTAAEIGELLHLSVGGVRSQIGEIYRILGVHTKKEARFKLNGVDWTRPRV